MISRRVQAIKAAPTLLIDAKAKTLKQQGVDIVNFGPGEPDFDTPKHIKEIAIKAIDEGYTKYLPVGGTIELKDAIINKLKRDNNLDYLREEIIVSCGAKHSIYNLLQTIIDDGDEVIILAPFWVSYTDMVSLAGGKPVIINTDAKSTFKVSPEQIKKAITKKTKALILNSPSNPTGSAYSASELEAIGTICVQNNVLIIADDIYEKLVYDGFKFVSIASLSKEIKEMTIVINGVSKAYAMTGWRIGYAAGRKDVIEGMSKIQSQSTSNPTSISMKASVEALNGDQSEVEVMRKEFEKRRDFIVDALNKIENVECLKPQGSFYVFPNIQKYLGKTFEGRKIATDIDLADFLLDRAKIAIVPGSPFGVQGHIRLSYALSIQDSKKGIDRLKSALEELKDSD
ncbi:MAG: pyridoxal phosphate-dependent aminotransferase [Elusimicrobiota bacterium]|jgi:aspartate aminotransferase|nr:pyridoxal phosphate-dependent aminotransferase [Elusimicrobiota bacterium]